MKKRLFFLLLIQLISFSIYAQENLASVIDSLKTEYSLFPGKYPHSTSDQNEEMLPPPPPSFNGTEDYEKNYIKAYAIPANVIMQYYPWNADSITISFDLHITDSLAGENKEIKLNKKDIRKFIETLYKYDLDKSKPSIITIVSIEGTPIPNFRLTFYHQDNYLMADFYRHFKNPFTIIDSSVTEIPVQSETASPNTKESYSSIIEWGRLFHITFEELAKYIEKRFKHQVYDGKYDFDYMKEGSTDEEPIILDLIEQAPSIK